MEKVVESKIERTFQGRDFLELLRKQGKLFAVLFGAIFLIALLAFIYKVPYVSKGRLLVNDSQNSSLQAFSTTYFGMTKSLMDGRKGNTQIGKQIEMLRTREFYNKFIDEIKKRGESPVLNIDEQQAYLVVKEDYLDKFLKDEDSRQKFILKLDGWFQAKMDSDFELRISFATPSKELSLFLTNTALELSSNYLRERELADIQRMESFISEQQQLVDRNIKSLAQELADFQTKPENLISMTSREKVGEYLSDLMVRINETRLKIAENEKDMEFLRQEAGGIQQVGSSLYGVGGRIETLRLENKILQSRLVQLKKSVGDIGENLKTLPVAAQMLEDKRKKSELEYAKYKELSETLSKVEAQKLSAHGRFEILEKARLDNTLPQVDLVTLLFLSVLASLLLGLTIIYLKYLWNPLVLHKESVRNVMIYDDHNQDPRVVIENAKIKFQLGNHSDLE